ncbi:S-adenosyl-L-methionine-dependent methyltransferase [Ceratobasidium sp. AG-I]|nr:S-adenosyl-L-methionine-dependent methyltransferase [Ceratobasidium sp. AG-I]
MNFYKEAANMLDTIDSKKASVKGCLSLATPKDRKRLGALVIETLKFKPTIMSIIDATPIMRDERRHLASRNFAAVLIHDLLFNNGGIQAADGPIKQAVYRHKTRLHAELIKLKVRKGVQTNAELAQPEDPRVANIPRYLRVNRNAWTVEEASEYYLSKGYEMDSSSPVPVKNHFYVDAHVPDLFIFDPEHAIHSDDAYTRGNMMAQDKASCFPALVLDPPMLDDACVIDATAAPGNKTSHISALMGNKGKVFAFERNKRRFDTLEQMLARAKCKNVEPILTDFLSVNPLDTRFRKVSHMYVSPVHCNKDGTDENTESRLAALSSFQKCMILHAIKFPSVTRIVYSTCSIHSEENEAVVKEVLEHDEVCHLGFKLAPRSQVLPLWTRRGQPFPGLSSNSTESLIRCSPGEDNPGTNGFFVSCFIRHKPSLPLVEITRKRRNPTIEDDRLPVRRKREAHKAE